MGEEEAGEGVVGTAMTAPPLAVASVVAITKDSLGVEVDLEAEAGVQLDRWMKKSGTRGVMCCVIACNAHSMPNNANTACVIIRFSLSVLHM